MNKKYFFAIGILILLVLLSIACAFGIWFWQRSSLDSSETESSSTDEDTTTTTTDTISESPSDATRLIFIHHSTGENWLSDDDGELGIDLMNNNYFVSDTNYGWGSSGIGDTTDIGHWWTWFRGPDSSNYMEELYDESDQYSDYSRLSDVPTGKNEIIMFKSCFPNSALSGSQYDMVLDIGNNLLKGEDSYSSYHTVANAKGIYVDILEYFETKQDKLFIVVTAPPLTDSTYASNAKAFNAWLVSDWLADYEYNNVAVFDFFSILADDSGVLEYPTGSGDDHPSTEGNLLATEEFTPFLNDAYFEWKE
ncbi:SGNH/GDSL hydrolase family protein [Patescibacteria group bacterium]